MKTLIIDTALGACTAVAADHSLVVAAATEGMTRGHQERLGGMVRTVMAAARWSYDDLARIAVTTGPGSFTGLRVGLAFAQGLGLALDRPVSGLSTLGAFAHDVESRGVVWALIDARRGQVYGQPFQDGAPLDDPAALNLEAAAARMAGTQARIAVGSGAALTSAPGVETIVLAAPSPRALARVAAEQPQGEARPLYLRAPDAKLPGGRAPE
ncbi:MAG: tRNA (adenosine(37)-N6)-threonylcarbamoyltransferase complex dimerization subunit type 1 TsaB [Brevundimonas sp.]|uniref:tRNA (adenosine(37)-N6)-threonylcarbamoyltransferase complex dimerization subunit type 1 TsaB n=1 Tax=Brevundimonas sp. TaxID=1871086 RepID=UPI00391A9EE9